MADPAFVWKVAGVTIDPAAQLIVEADLDLYQRDMASTLRWAVPANRLTTSADPYIGKTISLDIDPDGTGSVRRFTGRCVAGPLAHGPTGWERQYVAYCLRYLADRVPVTTASGSVPDLLRYNLDWDDPEYAASRASRALGEI